MYRDTFADRNQEATVWVGNLDLEVDEELLVELMMQAGPVMSVNMPHDKITGRHQGFAFVEFRSEADADYAMKVLNMVRLISQTIKINKASREHGEQDIGANLFVGNLDPDVDEQLLFTTFSTFGQVMAARVMYDEVDGKSKGFGFINFSDFDSADNALRSMNGQFLCNKQITVSFAYKKGENGPNAEKHGSIEERKLAGLQRNDIKIHTRFSATAPSQAPTANKNASSLPRGMPPIPMPMGIPMGMLPPQNMAPMRPGMPMQMIPLPAGFMRPGMPVFPQPPGRFLGRFPAFPFQPTNMVGRMSNMVGNQSTTTGVIVPQTQPAPPPPPARKKG